MFRIQSHQYNTIIISLVHDDIVREVSIETLRNLFHENFLRHLENVLRQHVLFYMYTDNFDSRREIIELNVNNFFSNFRFPLSWDNLYFNLNKYYENIQTLDPDLLVVEFPLIGDDDVEYLIIIKQQYYFR